MHALLECQILSGGQGHTGRGDSFDSRVICQIGEQHRTVNRAGTAELADKELRFLIGDTNGSEDNGEIGSRIAAHLGLTGNLSRQIGMRQAGAGEDRQLLTTDQGVQAVDRGNASLDKLVGIVTGSRVHG